MKKALLTLTLVFTSVLFLTAAEPGNLTTKPITADNPSALIYSTPVPKVSEPSVSSSDLPSRFSVGAFGSVRTRDFDGDYRTGVGIELGIGLTKNLSVTFNMLTENTHSSSIDEAGAAFKFRAPLGSVLIPYARLGYAFDIENETHQGVGGIGGEIAVTGNLRLFSDANWYTDARKIGHALGRLGVSLTF